MALATWWKTDPLPPLAPLPGLRAEGAVDTAMLAGLNGLTIAAALARRQEGHRPYVAFLHDLPVAYGWVATRVASIGELETTITLPPTDRYLWDFATLPAWQGRGIYPRLLQAILQQESRAAERFWIIAAPENMPSGAGMRKAGFSPVAELSFDTNRAVRLAPIGAYERAQAAAALLGVPLVDDPLAPCWACQNGGDSACWPQQGGESRACTCAIERMPTTQIYRDV
jgi:GNAT superfamily N-acetyltransferase